MKIVIKSYLSDSPLPGGVQVIERDILFDECTISKLLRDIGIFKDELVLYFVNQKRVKKDYLLRDGDVIELVSLLEGG